VHGRKRRKQRGISRRDLQAAVKHGTKTPCHPGPDGRPRGKFTHNNVVYITDQTCRQEITAWNDSASPLPFPGGSAPAPAAVSPVAAAGAIAVDSELRGEHLAAISTRPATVTSHTVLIVDMSGSMKAHDVPGYRGSRAQAVYENIAKFAVKPQLEKNVKPESRMLDAVSLIETKCETRQRWCWNQCRWIAIYSTSSCRDATKPGRALTAIICQR
jgi:hypothetical protein